MAAPDPERRRLAAMRAGTEDWRGWGPYVSERQWGTVREDYSADGDAWAYFPHDHARSRAYRWGEDGIGGFCDDRQLLCLSLALWNGKDPILKERLFGLTNAQGNHGEDVKELYYFLDAVPSHAYQRMLYKLPQAAFPYERLLEENARRDRTQPEFELIDTGIFEDDRYFDIEIEYAKAAPGDILMRITAHNRGPDAAPLTLLPQAWFRNVWSWSDSYARPTMREDRRGEVVGDHDVLGPFALAFEDPDRLLFCDNDTNGNRLFGVPNPPGAYFKDGIDAFVVHGDRSAVNPEVQGTKVAGLYRRHVPPGGSVTVRVRLAAGSTDMPDFTAFDAVFAERKAEADAFYEALQAGVTDADMRLVQRQAFAGLLWSKQFYHFDVAEWLDGDPRQPPPPPNRREGRNAAWRHLSAADIIAMPDTWEYPWFAAWDLGFHCVSLSLVDPEFAKSQLLLLSQCWMMHPNGQLPAYEWAFGDVNPPVQAWAALNVYDNDRRWNDGQGDFDFLQRIFHKLLLNFTWWVNRKDAQGLNIFEGGFLGLDNIGLFDRSAGLPNGGRLQQSDATAWMAMYCITMLHIALELGQHDRVYEDMATKFFEHLLYIAQAMTGRGQAGGGLWDDTDAFYYDRLMLPDGTSQPLRIRSMVGLIPLFAVAVVDGSVLRRLPGFLDRLRFLREERSDLATLVSRWNDPGSHGRHLLSLARVYRMTKLLERMLDEAEFLSPHGVRALSQVYRDSPFEVAFDGVRYRMQYQPAESDSGMFGGNSNWRGPVWMPVNYLLIESLRRFHSYYGPDFTIECPTGSHQQMTLDQVADHLCERLVSLFLRDADGRRPVFGGCEKMQTDPHFRDLLLFHEYFDGDTGRGLGASHQTGWTALVANMIDQLANGGQRPLGSMGGVPAGPA
ncbi:MAG: glucosidase [Rhodospirillales bacterium]|nr:glucosidase [Rhodospirillales bacterium]